MSKIGHCKITSYVLISSLIPNPLYLALLGTSLIYSSNCTSTIAINSSQYLSARTADDVWFRVPAPPRCGDAARVSRLTHVRADHARGPQHGRYLVRFRWDYRHNELQVPE